MNGYESELLRDLQAALEAEAAAVTGERSAKKAHDEAKAELRAKRDAVAGINAEIRGKAMELFAAVARTPEPTAAVEDWRWKGLRDFLGGDEHLVDEIVIVRETETLGELAEAVRDVGGFGPALRAFSTDSQIDALVARIRAYSAEHPGFPVELLNEWDASRPATLGPDGVMDDEQAAALEAVLEEEAAKRFTPEVAEELKPKKKPRPKKKPAAVDAPAEGPAHDWAGTPLNMVVVRGDLVASLKALDLHTLGDLADACDLCGCLTNALDDMTPLDVEQVEHDVRSWSSKRPGFPIESLQLPDDVQAEPDGTALEELHRALYPDGQNPPWRMLAKDGASDQEIRAVLCTLWPDSPEFVEPERRGDFGHTVRGGERPAFWVGDAKPNAAAMVRPATLMADGLVAAIRRELRIRTPEQLDEAAPAKVVKKARPTAAAARA